MGDGASTGAIWGDDTGLGSNGYGCDLTFLIILVVGDDDNDDDDYMVMMITMAFRKSLQQTANGFPWTKFGFR